MRKFILVRFFLFCVLVACNFNGYAQCDPLLYPGGCDGEGNPGDVDDGPVDIPIDGGISFLLLGAAAVGYKALKKKDAH